MPRNIWLLIIGMAINVTGASFIWPLNTIYMHNELGESLAFAGVILMLNQGFAIVGNLIGGSLFDRWGGYKTILTGSSIAVVAATLLAFFHTITAYTLLLIVMGFGSGITRPAMFAMAGSVWPEGGRRAFNSIYVAQNLGVALGASIGGFVAAFSFGYIFIANAAIYILFFIYVFLTYKNMDTNTHTGYAGVKALNTKIKDKTAFRALLILSVGFFMCWIGYVQWQTTIASYTQDLGIPINQYSLLWTINGFLIVASQPILKIVTKKIEDPRKHIYIGNTIFILSFIVVLYAQSFTMFAVAMVILTIGEMLVWPAIPTLANQLAPKGRTGFYQGFINSVSTAGHMIGPLLGGFIVDQYHIEILFYILIGLFIIPYWTTYRYNKGLPAEKELHTS
ncbi:MFS transporter [Radiobacillus kanasensis]|uniref:MDR family MFS transporter n=1 Tax=Radiobacillus kanasensis TaxID=2844358 RepID=UPI001E30B0B5|nr:MFS transporter [Radiobacillus kanasensis]UFT98616.1 MFS transporter [Radiobacillus kanasensis]